MLPPFVPYFAGRFIFGRQGKGKQAGGKGTDGGHPHHDQQMGVGHLAALRSGSKKGRPADSTATVSTLSLIHI